MRGFSTTVRLTTYAVVLAGLGCSASPGDFSSDGGGGVEGESCLRNSDCLTPLACVALRCTRQLPDASVPDSGHLSNLGESCLRSADCVPPLRCVQMTCEEPMLSSSSSGGGSSGGGSSSSGASASSSSSSSSSGSGASSSSGDVPDGGYPDAGAVDAAVLQPAGCGMADPIPRGTGACCTNPSDCVSGLCIQGMCSAQCSEPSHCAITATSTPFQDNATLSCAPYPTLAGRACLPGSLAPCTQDSECADDELCAVAHASMGDGGFALERRCTAARRNGATTDNPCTTSADCSLFNPAGGECLQGVCRAVCGDGEMCPGRQECTPLVGNAELGLCQGAPCGEAPAGVDALCEVEQVCVPAPDPAAPGGFVPRCAPAAANALPVGAACTEAQANRCSNRACVDGRCTRLCQWDGDCPSALPFCLERPLAWAGDQPVAVCASLPASNQLCQRESDCGVSGCAFVGERSLFSTCTVQGTSLLTDTLCGDFRKCDDGKVCMPDTYGTLRCTPRGRVGDVCNEANDCLSGVCADANGPLGNGGVGPGRCSSRCLTAADCDQGMACRSVPSVAVVTPGAPFYVFQPLCLPLSQTPACASSQQCVNMALGTTCDLATGVCHTSSATVGHTCDAQADCQLGLTCADGACVREGCIPYFSGVTGCSNGEVCVETSPITAECRLECSSTSQCQAVNPTLQCLETSPRACGSP